MEKKNATCPVCGGSEYIKECGFYYCAECQTQSQELREEIFEEFGIGSTPAAKSQSLKKKQTKDDENLTDESWTSWEAYNFILKGQVDELIELGASPKLKIIILQLWAYYLKKLEVAFTSKTAKVFPKIGPSYHPKDRYFTYGHKIGLGQNSKKKLKKTSLSCNLNLSIASDASTVASCSRKRFNQNKSALMKEESEVSQINSSFLNRSGSELDDSSSSATSSVQRRRTKFSKTAKEILRRKKSTNTEKSLRKSRILHSTNPNTISRFRLVVLLYIGLICSGECIHLSDLLRWIREGHLSYFEITHLLPSYYRIKGVDCVLFDSNIFLPSYSNFQKTAKNMIKLLEVTDWPKPNLLDLATRFIQELNLPAMFTTLVERFMVVASFSTLWKPGEVPSYERRVVAIIIVILKLFLGLDGQTEDSISESAMKITKLQSKSNSLPSDLFIWNNWVKYSICRKAILIRHHFPTKDKVAPELFISPFQYINYYKEVESYIGNSKSKMMHSETCAGIKPVLADALKWPFQKLSEIQDEERSIKNFPPSLTPCNTYINHILKFYRDERKEDILPKDILHMDFTLSSMEYLMKPRLFVKLAKMNNCKLNVQKKSAQEDFKRVKKVVVKKKPYQPDKKMVVVKVASKAIQSKSKSSNEMSGQRNELNKSRTYEEKSLHSNQVNERRKQQNVNVESGTCSKRKRDVCEDDETLISKKKKHKFIEPAVLTLCSDDESLRGSELSDRYSLGRDSYADLVSITSTSCNSASTTRRQVTDKIIQHTRPLLPDKTIMLLHKFLTTGSSNNTVEGDKTLNNEKGNSSFDLYLPYTEYWMLESSLHYDNDNEFELKVASKLPHSFLWLLSECACMLEMTKKDLYQEIVQVESLCADILGC